MFIHLIIFFLSLFLLFYLAKKISSCLFSLIYLLSRNKKFSLAVLAVIFLPGTIIHELSHFVAATILKVPVGQLSIFPTIEDNAFINQPEQTNIGREVKVGKLTLAKTDIFRQSLIGISPLAGGILTIYLIGRFLLQNYLLDIYAFAKLDNQLFYIFLLSVVCYLLFVISVTMFASKKDLEKFHLVVLIIVLIFFFLYFIGVRIFLAPEKVKETASFLAQINYYLVFTLMINLLILILLSLKLYFWQKILKRRLKII